VGFSLLHLLFLGGLVVIAAMVVVVIIVSVKLGTRVFPRFFRGQNSTQRVTLSATANVHNPSRIAYRPRARLACPIDDELPNIQVRRRTEGSESESHRETVLFNWNGHTWDAYEVLGLESGHDAPGVDQAFEKLHQHVDPESRAFIQAAYEAIRKRRS